ncbi:hypothetical protein [Dyadobacter sp. LHD-138]|uniref:hypothetical protein n=1 Tax=Dyadobacter sp. LHD-138 TaxID=3071413 RepID=UPI0027E1BC14|nr:hypothetical protein [Dyadobacter sp. LHD-138]MDQ6477814.1 hypothetical protein [Dyadobacter sp. LHD-138]
MTKVLTYSRTFPAFHPKKGQPTHFVEKLIEGFLELGDIEITDDQLNLCDFSVMRPDVWSKYTTIRAGNNWKAGDMFSPRVWSGKPYNSPQIIIAPDIRIEKVWDVEVDEDLCLWIVGGDEQDEGILEKVARNDGLELQDLLSWFNKPMSGQIICWNKNIEY